MMEFLCNFPVSCLGPDTTQHGHATLLHICVEKGPQSNIEWNNVHCQDYGDSETVGVNSK